MEKCSYKNLYEVEHYSSFIEQMMRIRSKNSTAYQDLIRNAPLEEKMMSQLKNFFQERAHFIEKENPLLENVSDSLGLNSKFSDKENKQNDFKEETISSTSLSLTTKESKELVVRSWPEKPQSEFVSKEKSFTNEERAPELSYGIPDTVYDEFLMYSDKINENENAENDEIKEKEEKEETEENSEVTNSRIDTSVEENIKQEEEKKTKNKKKKKFRIKNLKKIFEKKKDNV